MEFVRQAEKKRGAGEDLEGPRRKDQDGEPREGAGVPAAPSGEARAGDLPPTEARGPGEDVAAAAADVRDDAGREEDLAGQPGRGGGRLGRRLATTRRTAGAGAHRPGAAEGLEPVAEGDEELPEARDPAVAEGDAAAHGAAGEDDLFEGMVNEYPEVFGALSTTG